MTPQTPEPIAHPADRPGQPEHIRAVAREFFASALYVAIVLLAALVALPKDHVPSDATVVGILFGTAIGLIAAHFVAFRLAAHFTAEGGVAPAPILQEAGAGLAGGLLVAAIAAIPYLLWNGDGALTTTLLALALLPAFMGLAIARLRGRSWTTSLISSAVALAAALVVVLIKQQVGH
jgi:hypothetical protein